MLNAMVRYKSIPSAVERGGACLRAAGYRCVALCVYSNLRRGGHLFKFKSTATIAIASLTLTPDALAYCSSLAELNSVPTVEIKSFGASWSSEATWTAPLSSSNGRPLRILAPKTLAAVVGSSEPDWRELEWMDRYPAIERATLENNGLFSSHENATTQLTILLLQHGSTVGLAPGALTVSKAARPIKINIQ